jgi:hypothetical protein
VVVEEGTMVIGLPGWLSFSVRCCRYAAGSFVGSQGWLLVA